jgi:hypothetical protein
MTAQVWLNTNLICFRRQFVCQLRHYQRGRKRLLRRLWKPIFAEAERTTGWDGRVGTAVRLG